ncbi:RNA binding motif protein 18 [Bacillus velezensis]|uniref:RNA binding motif protein 18 n=1 Tax=Bacillus velezensis TaxID=492670 RepID=UPI0021F11AC6|nr:RNA binding motif protein 18 [Bacillus velezensis]MCV4329388.1 RNA binding motif protein 18 [Bacillus velezensis]
MAYRIVGELKGTEITFTSTHPDREKREETYETIEDAEEAVKTLKMSLPEGTKLTIEPAV